MMSAIELPDGVYASLERLEEAQLLQRLAELDLAYLFSHALTQETAYQSLLRKRRREIHLMVARSYEQLYAGRIDEYAALLAQHYAEAGDNARTLEYSRRAGDAAARVYATDEALLHYSRALQVAKEALSGEAAADPGALRADDVLPLLASLYLGRGRALEMSTRWQDALRNYEEMETIGRERGDHGLEMSALIACAGIYATPNPAHDAALAQNVLAQALTLAQRTGNQPAEARALWILMLLHSFDGQPRAAIPYGEQALALARELGLDELAAFTLNGLFMAYWPIGDVERACAVLEEARELWLRLGNLLMLAENYTRFSLIQFSSGEYDAAVASSDEAFRVAGSISHLWGQANSRAMIAHIYLDRGQSGRAIAVMEEAIDLGEQSGHPAVLIGTRADLGWTLGWLGDIDQGLALARVAEAHARSSYPLLLPWALASIARLLARQGDLDGAGVTIREARRVLNPEGSFHAPVWVGMAEAEIALAGGAPERALAVADALLAYLEKSAWRPFRADARYYRAQALLMLGRDVEARADLEQARLTAEALGIRRSLLPALVLAGDLAWQRGQTEEATAYRAKAQEIARYMVEQAGKYGVPDEVRRAAAGTWQAKPGPS